MTKLTGSQDIRFDNRVAVVTGAGRGLGRAYALELAKRGARVVVNDFGGPMDTIGKGAAPVADKVVEEIQTLGGTAVASHDSVATSEGGEAIVKTAIEDFGGLDILINNAGIFKTSRIAQTEPEEWDQILAVHLTGTYNVTRPAFLKMRDQGYGRIVMTTSEIGLFGGRGLHYAAAKMGVIGFMNALKLEGDPCGIKVNAISPAAYTRMAKEMTSPEFIAKAKPEFIAPLVLYLCSDLCPVSGSIYFAGMGYYRRVAVTAGAGVMVGDGKNVPTPDEIHRHWDAINDLNRAKEYYSDSESVAPMFDETAKSRHSGENRSPDKLEPIDITGFRPSPE